MPNLKVSSIYAIRNKTTGRVYIGRSYTPKDRMAQHLQSLKRGDSYYGTDSFKEDFDKYGAQDFEGYILETGVIPAKFREREEFWINEYKATDPRYGYNKNPMAPGASLQIASGLPPRPNHT